MKMHFGLLSLGLLLAGFAFTARTSEGASSAAPAQTATPLVGNAAVGKQTFTQYCSICHGVGARGFIGPYIAGINWTTPGLHAIVRGGVGGYGGMPAFNADVVTDSNIADIAAYLATLPPAQPRNAAQAPQATSVVAGTAVAISTAAATTPASATAALSSASSSAPPISTGAGDPAHGQQVYTANCAACHGANAQGGIGPALHGERTRKDTASAIAWIKNPLPPMPKLYPSVLSEKDVKDVAAFVESL